MGSVLSYYVSLLSVFRVMFAKSGVQHMLCYVLFRFFIHHTLQVSVSVFHNVALFIFMEFSYFTLRKKRGERHNTMCMVYK
jgi:hypothetical protein